MHEGTGEIIQVTQGPASGTGSLNLARKTMKLYVMRGGPVRGADSPAPPAPRQLVEIDLQPLIADARARTPRAP
ncbi:MAG TPA: hypothetical protein PKX00_06680, partial [Opitutaceae bacterium]|nr:hypothetical protein [Opitutaceae bacterium]